MVSGLLLEVLLLEVLLEGLLLMSGGGQMTMTVRDVLMQMLGDGSGGGSRTARRVLLRLGGRMRWCVRRMHGSVHGEARRCGGGR